MDEFDSGPWLIPKNKKVIIICSPRSGANAFGMLLCDLGNRTYIGEHYHPDNSHNNPEIFEYPLEPIPERSVMKIMPGQVYPKELLNQDDVFIIDFRKKNTKDEWVDWADSFKCHLQLYIEDILHHFPKDKYPIRPDGLPSTSWKG